VTLSEHRDNAYGGEVNRAGHFMAIWIQGAPVLLYHRSIHVSKVNPSSTLSNGASKTGHDVVDTYEVQPRLTFSYRKTSHRKTEIAVSEAFSGACHWKENAYE
jgi:hypothetical protein